MIDTGKAGLALVLLAILPLAGCVVAQHEDEAAVDKGNQYLGYGVEAFAAGQPAVAESRFLWALGIFEYNGDLDGQIRAHINLAEYALRTRQLSRAAAHAARAEELAITAGESRYLRRILLIRSSVALKAGDYSGARVILTELLAQDSRAAAGQAVDGIHLAALVNRAVLSERQGDDDFTRWVSELKQSLGAARGPSRSVEARLLRFDAEVYRLDGNFSKADAAFRSALASYESAHSDIEVGATLFEWAQLDMERGRWPQASNKLRRSILLRDDAGDREGVMKGLQLLMKVESERGRTQQANALRELIAVLGDTRSSQGVRLSDLIGPAANPE